MMNSSDRLVLDALKAQVKYSKQDWALIEDAVEKAGGIMNVDGVARTMLEKAAKQSFGGNRSAAGRYAAGIRWGHTNGMTPEQEAERRSKGWLGRVPSPPDRAEGRYLGNGGFDLRLDPTKGRHSTHVSSGSPDQLGSRRKVVSIAPINASELKRGQVINFQDPKTGGGGNWTVHSVTRNGSKVTATLQPADTGVTHWREGPKLKLVERPWRLRDMPARYQKTYEFHVNDIVDQLRLGPAEEFK